MTDIKLAHMSIPADDQRAVTIYPHKVLENFDPDIKPVHMSVPTDDQRVEAVCRSIEHWHDLFADPYSGTHYGEHCALCQLYKGECTECDHGSSNDHEDDDDDDDAGCVCYYGSRCDGCPISGYTGKQLCVGTVWDKFNWEFQMYAAKMVGYLGGEPENGHLLRFYAKDMIEMLVDFLPEPRE